MIKRLKVDCNATSGSKKSYGIKGDKVEVLSEYFGFGNIAFSCVKNLTRYPEAGPFDTKTDNLL